MKFAKPNANQTSAQKCRVVATHNIKSKTRDSIFMFY
jgi:hypothetical protein